MPVRDDFVSLKNSPGFLRRSGPVTASETKALSIAQKHFQRRVRATNVQHGEASKQVCRDGLAELKSIAVRQRRVDQCSLRVRGLRRRFAELEAKREFIAERKASSDNPCPVHPDPYVSTSAKFTLLRGSNLRVPGEKRPQPKAPGHRDPRDFPGKAGKRGYGLDDQRAAKFISDLLNMSTQDVADSVLEESEKRATQSHFNSTQAMEPDAPKNQTTGYGGLGTKNALARGRPVRLPPLRTKGRHVQENQVGPDKTKTAKELGKTVPKVPERRRKVRPDIYSGQRYNFSKFDKRTESKVCTCPILHVSVEDPQRPKTPPPIRSRDEKDDGKVHSLTDFLNRFVDDDDKVASRDGGKRTRHALTEDDYKSIPGYSIYSNKLLAQLPSTVQPERYITGGHLFSSKRAALEMLKISDLDANPEFWKTVLHEKYEQLCMMNNCNRMILRELQKIMWTAEGQLLTKETSAKQYATITSVGEVEVVGNLGKINKRTLEELIGQKVDDKGRVIKEQQKGEKPKAFRMADRLVASPQMDTRSLKIFMKNDDYSFWKQKQDLPLDVMKHLRYMDALQFVEDATWSRYIDYVWTLSKKYREGETRVFENFDNDQHWDYCLYMARLLIKALELESADMSTYVERRRWWWQLRMYMPRAEAKAQKPEWGHRRCDEWKFEKFDRLLLPSIYLSGLEVSNIYRHFGRGLPKFLEDLTWFQLHCLGRPDRFSKERFHHLEDVETSWSDLFCVNGHLRGECKCSDDVTGPHTYKCGVYTLNIVDRRATMIEFIWTDHDKLAKLEAGSLLIQVVPEVQNENAAAASRNEDRTDESAPQTVDDKQ